MTTTNNYKWFDIEKCSSPDVAGSYEYMNKAILTQLEAIGEVVGKRMLIKSGYRTIQHNAKVKGSVNSSHLRGYAVDVICFTGRDKWVLLNAAIKVGINRIGIGKSFLHLDCDPNLVSKVIFTY